MDNKINRFDNGGGYNGGNRGNTPGDNGGGGNEPPRRPNVLMMVLSILSLIFLGLMIFSMFFLNKVEGEKVSYTQFLQYMEEGRIEQVVVQSNRDIKDIAVYFTLKKDAAEDRKSVV